MEAGRVERQVPVVLREGASSKVSTTAATARRSTSCNRSAPSPER
jgi:hypothetical protein